MTKTFTTSKGEFELHTLPPKIAKNYGKAGDDWYDSNTRKMYTLIGKVSSLTEEQCKEVVDSEYFGGNYSRYPVYRNYMKEYNCYLPTAKDSFLSLLESLGLAQSDLWLFKIIEHENN